MGEGGRVLRRDSKKNETVAALSWWYKFDVGALPKDRQDGLLANLSRLQAQQQIHDQRYDPLDYTGVKDLWLAAYGDEDLAQKAQTESLTAYVRAETEAARRK